LTWIHYIILACIGAYFILILVYYFIQERFLFVATPLQKKYVFKISQEYDEYFLETNERGRINALHIKSVEKKGLILYFHGNTGNLKRWSLTGSEFTSLGYDVLMFDYRGFGKSKGKRNEKNMHIDCRAVYNLACTLYPPENVHLYARSMGSGMAIKLATQINATKLFLETPYYSMVDVAKFHVPFIPVKWLLRFSFNSYLWIQDVKCPIYILHGTKDRIIPYQHALKLYNLISKNPKNLMVTIPRGKHSNLNSFPIFREKFIQFLEL